MPTPPAHAPARPDRRTTTAIVAGMLAPVAALAVMSLVASVRTPAKSAAAGSSTAAAPAPAPAPAPVLNPARRLKVEVVASYPHDPKAFTQGLLYQDGVLYESTGLLGESTIRRVDLATGRVLRKAALERSLFGEGIALVPEGLLQLTWKNQRGILYDPRTLAVRQTFGYRGEGWGLCFDGTSLVMSEGTEYLVFRSAKTFEKVREVRVMLEGAPVPFLNELECVDGSVYANSWRRDFILRIDPASGIVQERIDASTLLTAEEAKDAEVLNGIAYDRADGTFLITGKRWPKLFRVRFVPAGT